MIEFCRAVLLFSVGFNAHHVIWPTFWGPAVAVLVTVAGAAASLILITSWFRGAA